MVVTIIKCNCGDPACNTYSLSDGMFYQGNGWPKERAQQYADAINSYDANSQLVTALVEALQWLLSKSQLSSYAHTISSSCDCKSCAIANAKELLNALNPPPTQLPLEHTELKAEREDGS